MRSVWLFAPRDAWSDDHVTLPAAEARHAARVLRLQDGAPVTVFDGAGAVAACVLTDAHEGYAEVLERESVRRPTPQIVVYQGAAKSGKLDDAIERLAELGVAEVWTFSSERTVARWDEAKLNRLTDRWADIARAAAKQSRNPYVLTAHGGLSFADVIERVRGEDFALTLWEEASLPLRTVFPPGPARLAIVVGPEGGLTRDEADALADAGAPAVSLGPTILRTENAALVAAAAVQYHYGLLG